MPVGQITLCDLAIHFEHLIMRLAKLDVSKKKHQSYIWNQMFDRLHLNSFLKNARK